MFYILTEKSIKLNGTIDLYFCHLSKWCVSQKLHDKNIKIKLFRLIQVINFRISYTEKNH